MFNSKIRILSFLLVLCMIVVLVSNVPIATATSSTTDLQINLNPYFNEDGFSHDSDRTDGNFDTHGYTYSADLASASTTYDSTTYTLGSFAADIMNSVNCTGQTITLYEVSGYQIRIVAAATGGNQTGTFRINYTDSTYTDTSIIMRDWCRKTAADQVVQTLAHRHSQTADDSSQTYMYAYYLTPTQGKTIKSVTLPNNTKMHILAITLYQTSNINITLDTYFNEDAFSYDSDRTDGNFDSSGYTFSADLASSTATLLNTVYQFGAFTNDSLNSIKCNGQVITLNQASDYQIRIAAAASGGNQTGVFRINYTDSTYTDTSITMKDWCRMSSTDQVIQSFAHRHSQTADDPTKTYIYAYYLTPTLGKTIQNITLPSNTNMHVLAITLYRVQDSTLSRASRVLIEKGIQYHSWITTDDTGRPYPSTTEFNSSNFTGSTYYEPNLYNGPLQNALPNLQWNLAKAPYCTNAVGQNPTSYVNWFTTEMNANSDKCVSICFGDEQAYSTAEEGYLKNWFDLTHAYYPDTLVHTNQYLNQWSSAQLDSYMTNTKPDLLTYDSYYYDTVGTTKEYAMPARIMNAVNSIRPKALAGYDGTGNSPIAFGQYLFGFKRASDLYEPTESQKYFVANITLTMGGKWLDVFRWDYQSNDMLMVNSDGTLNHHFYEFAENARQTKNLGPHLVRLNSTDVRVLPGKHLSSGNAIENSLPSTVARFAANSNYYITGIASQNLGTQNDGLAGDVIIGYFEPLPGLDTTEFFTSTNPKYFMVCNGLTSGNGLLPANQHGTNLETQQKVTLTFDVGTNNPNKLRKVSRDTGNVENVTLTLISGTTYKLELTLGGGNAELLFWE